MKLRVISLNLYHGGLFWQPILDFLDKEKPDVVLLQEAYNGTDPSLDSNFRTIQEFQRHYPDSYIDFAPSFNDIDRPPVPADRGNAIMSAFPIKARSNIFFHGDYSDSYHDLPGNFHNCPRNLQHVTIDVDGIDLDVFNFQGVWDLDGENDSEERLHMSQTIIEAVQGKTNVILGGDTNVNPGTQTVNNIEKHLHNVFGKELTTTFNMLQKTNPGYATAVVDMLFTTPTLRVLEHDCPQVDISDHLPLTATIEL